MGFPKITSKKKYALRNSYFKHRKMDYPANPFEILDYAFEHQELPYSGEIELDWFYDCFVEYQKRAGVVQSQFFTPPTHGLKMASLLEALILEGDETFPILDLCAGYGQLSLMIEELGIPNPIEAIESDMELVAAYRKLVPNGKIEFGKMESLLESNKQYKYIISNPPYEIPAMIQFFTVLDKILMDGGKAVVLLPKGFPSKTRPAKLKDLLEKFKITQYPNFNDVTFERTKILGEIVKVEKR